MKKRTAHLAIDLGASSGRGILGLLEGDPLKVELVEIHRFEHFGQPTPAGPVWDLTGIWANILESLKLAGNYCRDNGCELESVGVDTWGVDWALLGKSGELLSLPHCYRDPQNEAAQHRVLEKIGGNERLYERTGIQLMHINTLFQVAARFDAEPELFAAARHLVFMPDLFHFWLSGEVSVERTIASTSGMLNVETGDWDRELLQEIGLPTHLLGSIIDPGTLVGRLRDEVIAATQLEGDVQVIAPAGHDTGDAVAAVPVEDASSSNWAYLSSGTWSLLGAEIASTHVSEAAREFPFTNELGVNRTVRFLKNITGLWMVQELRREFNSKDDNDYSFQQLMEAASVAEPFRTLVDPNSKEFLDPGQMAEKMRSFARATNQPESETVGDLIRCAVESLALCYAATTQALGTTLDCQFDVLHIVGGGSKNELLNQMTANALGHDVICGPAEATAIGNVLIQAIGGGAIANLKELRAIVNRSFSPVRYRPEEDDMVAWSEAMKRFAGLTG